MHQSYLSQIRVAVPLLTSSHFGNILSRDEIKELDTSLERHINSSWHANSRLDIHDRIRVAVDTSLSIVLKAVVNYERLGATLGGAMAIDNWKSQAIHTLKSLYESSSATFKRNQNTAEFLGIGTRALYLAVRHELGVPFHLGLVEVKINQLLPSPDKLISVLIYLAASNGEV